MAASVRLLPLLLCGCVVLAWHVLAQGAPPEEVSLPSARPASKVQSAAIFPRHLEQTTCGMVMLRGDQLLAASGHSLRKWTAGSESVGLLPRPEQNISAFAHSPKAKLVAAAYAPGAPGPGALLLHDEVKLNVLREFKDISHPITAMAFSPDGKTLAVAGRLEKSKDVIRIMAVESGTTLHQVEQSARAIEFSPNGTVLLFQSADGAIRFWAPPGSTVHEFPDPGDGKVRNFALSPQTKQMVTVGEHVTVWNLTTRKADLSLKAHQAPVRGVAYSTGGDWLATSDELGVVIVWETKNFQPVLVQETNIIPADLLAFSPDGKTLGGASRTSDTAGVIELDLANLEKMAKAVAAREGYVPPGLWFVASSGKTNSSAVARTGNQPFSRASAAAGIKADQFVIKPRPLYGSFQRIAEHETVKLQVPATHGALSFDGNLFAHTFGQSVRIYDTASFKLVHSIEIDLKPLLRDGVALDQITDLGVDCRPGPIALSLDGRRLAVGVFAYESSGKQWFNRTEVYDTATWTKIYQIPHRETTSCVALSPDGRYLAISRKLERRLEGASDGFVRLFDIEQKKQLLDLKQSSNSRGLRFSADGKKFLTPTSPPIVLDLPDLRRVELTETHPPYLDGQGKPDENVLKFKGESNALISPDGSRVLVATAPLQQLTVLDTRQNKRLKHLIGSFDYGDVELFNGGTHFLFGYSDFGRLELYDLDGKLLEKIVSPKFGGSLRYWLSGDNRLLLVATNDSLTIYATPLDTTRRGDGK